MEETALVKVNPSSEEAYLKLRDQSLGLLQYAEARTIASTDDIKPATDDLSLISKVKKAVDDKRKEYVNPLNDHIKAINVAFKTITEPLDQADKLTRDKILMFRNEQERLRREAEEINRQKEELARREAALNHGEITIDTKPVAVPEAQPAHVRTDMGNLGTQKVWKFEVADFALLPDDYKVADLVKIGKVIRAGVSVPGVKAWQEETLRITPTR